MLVLLIFQKHGQIKPTTLIIIGISMQTLCIALVQGLLITTKQLSAAKAYMVEWEVSMAQHLKIVLF